MINLRILVAVLLMAPAATAEAQQDETPNIATGNGLNEFCSGPRGDKSYCYGYIRGVAEMYQGRDKLCSPAGSEWGQAFDIVAAGLAAHPEERQKASIWLVGKYLTTAWRCPVKAK